MPPHDAPAVRLIGQALGVALKGMEVIMLGYINVRMSEQQDNREDELATPLVGSGLTDVTDHFTPIQWY